MEEDAVGGIAVDVGVERCRRCGVRICIGGIVADGSSGLLFESVPSDARVSVGTAAACRKQTDGCKQACEKDAFWECPMGCFSHIPLEV